MELALKRNEAEIEKEAEMKRH
jgi:hypothetical protein